MEGLNEVFPRLEIRAKDRAKACQKIEQQTPVPPLVVLGLVVAIPFYTAITVPLAIIGVVHRLILFHGKKIPTDAVSTDETRRITKEETSKGFPDDRPFDIVVLGATGLTGSLLARYLTTYHPKLKIALAGRTKSKVEAVKASLGAKDVGVIVADSSDLSSLFQLCRQTKVVATTVGPFKRYGTKLVHACAHSGTHYCDITGEVDWVEVMTTYYDGVAKRTGAAILSCCGVDSVPSDVSTFLVAQKLRKDHGEGTTVTKVEAIMTLFMGAMPSGTTETMVGIMDGTDVSPEPPMDFQAEEAVAPLGDTKLTGLMFPWLSHAKAFKQWTIPFFMAPANAVIVRRSNSLLGYASNMEYTERWGFPDISSAVVHLLGLYVMAAPWVALPLLRHVARATGSMHKADVGAKAATLEQCCTGSVCMVASGTGVSADTGDLVSASLRFAGVGGCGDAHTAICHAEIAALLAKRTKKEGGGCLSPIAALENSLPDALVKTGFVFIDDVPKNFL